MARGVDKQEGLGNTEETRGFAHNIPMLIKTMNRVELQVGCHCKCIPVVARVLYK